MSVKQNGVLWDVVIGEKLIATFTSRSQARSFNKTYAENHFSIPAPKKAIPSAPVSATSSSKQKPTVTPCPEKKTPQTALNLTYKKLAKTDQGWPILCNETGSKVFAPTRDAQRKQYNDLASSKVNTVVKQETKELAQPAKAVKPTPDISCDGNGPKNKWKKNAAKSCYDIFHNGGYVGSTRTKEEARQAMAWLTDNKKSSLVSYNGPTFDRF